MRTARAAETGNSRSRQEISSDVFYGRAELTKGAEDGFSDMQITLAASYPFAIGNSQFLVDGYFDWVLGLGDRDWNFHLNPQVTMDLGDMRNKPRKNYTRASNSISGATSTRFPTPPISTRTRRP